MEDVGIVGGGVIGLACALELADRGRQVTVYDAGRRGQASWAAAGILGPQSEVNEPSPMLDLCRRSFELYPEFVARLDADVGFRRNGTLHRAFTEEEAAKLRAQARWQTAAGLKVEERPDRSWFFPDEGQVDNRKLVLALRAVCEGKGVRFGPVDRPAIVCGGAWSGFGVFPVKGEIIALAAAPPGCVVFGGGGYLVPRGDLTLVGATSENRADTDPTAEGRDYLLAVAARHGYAGKPVKDHWAGLRPGTQDGLPLLGKASDVIVATGHYRNGILLAPITAKIVAALIEGEKSPVDLAPFDPLRYAARPPGRHP